MGKEAANYIAHSGNQSSDRRIKLAIFKVPEYPTRKVSSDVL